MKASSGDGGRVRTIFSQALNRRLGRCESLPSDLFDQILRHVLERREFGRRVFGAHAAFAVADHVHDPMQAVFHRPLIADHRSDRVGHQGQGGDVEASLLRDPAIDLALASALGWAGRPAFHAALPAACGLVS